MGHLEVLYVVVLLMVCAGLALACVACRRTRRLVHQLESRDAERTRIQAELERHQEHLEELVAERTREARAAFEAQAETLSFAQTISDNQPTLLAYIDRGLHLKFANRAILKFFGKEAADIGQHLSVVLGGRGVVQWDDGYIARVLGGETVERHMTLEDARGRRGHFLTYRLPDLRDGVVRGFYYIATDVTDVVKSEEELRVLNESLQTANDSLRAAVDFSREISDATPGAMTYWDADLRCRFANQTYLDWVGRPAAAVIGATRVPIYAATVESDVQVRLERALRGEAQVFEFQMKRKGMPARILEVHYTPAGPVLGTGRARGVYVMAFDITSLKHAEADLQRSNDELARSRDAAESATRAKSAFLANMSHEIRTPLNAILGLTHLVRRATPSGETAERLAKVSDAARHLLGLIDGVLDVSKIESGKLALDDTEFTLDDILTRAMTLVAEAARDKGLELILDAEAVDQPLRGDPMRLVQALVNLLGNAVKFTHRGTVTLRVRVAPSDAGAFALRFEVRDTGPGVPPEDLRKLFHAFEQVDNSATRRFGGAGLGLVITRHLARMMGGDAGAESSLGAGSTFWISVVLRSAGPALPVELPAALRGRRALVVDDQPDARAALAAMLHRLGLRAETAASADRALALALAAEAADDAHAVLLVDQAMPGTDGLELISRMRRLGIARDARVLVMCMSTGPRLQSERDALGIADVLVKPIGSAALTRQLTALLAAGAATPPSEASAELEAELRARHGGARVLVAEDNPVNQEVAQSLIEQAGLRVDLACNGREAVALAQAGAYDLVLMDLQMPELDGLAATRSLRARPGLAGMPIIAMTANAYLEDRERCMEAGMDDFLTKPVEPARLYGALRHWLDRAALAGARVPEVPDAAGALLVG